jgi:hypothetical protein
MKRYHIFRKHPNDVGMTYNEHRRFARMLARRTFAISVASLVHSFFPFLFTTTTSSTIVELYEILKFRNIPANNTNISETIKTITL